MSIEVEMFVLHMYELHLSCVSLDADGIDVQMVSRGPDQGDQRVDQQIPQARFAHGAVRVPSTALDHGKVDCQPSIFNHASKNATRTHARTVP